MSGNMIQYALKCEDGHSFESWFQSAEAYDKLARANMVACVICGSVHVKKAIMAPRVRPARGAAAQQDPDTTQPVGSTRGVLSTPANAAELALTKLRKQLEKSSDYVGHSFAQEARAIHEGESPKRSIYGEADLADAKALLEDGVPVTPLPFAVNRKVN
jgi:hypothetical protein